MSGERGGRGRGKEDDKEKGKGDRPRGGGVVRRRPVWQFCAGQID